MAVFNKRFLYYLSRFLCFPLVSPELLIVSLTEACNLSCPMCNIKKPPDAYNTRVDINKLYEIIDQAKTMDIKTLVLSGGEPFLAKEIFDIAAYSKKKGMNVSVTTNGVFNQATAEKIAISAISHIHFSLDGLEKVHDLTRGTGSFSRLLKSVKIIKSTNPEKSLGFGTVITSYNCRSLFAITKFADNLGVNVINFIPYLVNNIDPQHSPKGKKFSKLWLDKEEVDLLREEFQKIDNYRYRILKIDKNPDFESLIKYYSLDRISKVCFSGYKSIIITALRQEDNKPVSEVFFCQGSCGNIYEVSLRRAWHSLAAARLRIIARRCRNHCLQFCHYI